MRPPVGLTRLEGAHGQVAWQSNQEAYAAWLEHQAVRLAASTLQHHKVQINRYMRAWAEPVWKLTRQDLVSYVDQYARTCTHYRFRVLQSATESCNQDQDLSQCSTQCPAYEATRFLAAEAHLGVVNGLYEFFEHVGAVQANLFAGVRKQWRQRNKYRHRKVRARRVPTASEIQALLEAEIPVFHQALYVVQAKTGLRTSEALHLQTDPQHFRPEQGWMRLPDYYGKRRGNRHLIIDRELRQALQGYLEWRQETLQRLEYDHDRLFISHLGHPMGGRSAVTTINEGLRRDQKRAGLLDDQTPHFTSHGFRHFFSDQLKKNGCDDYWWNILRGDVPRGNLSTYVHPTQDDIRQQYERHAPRVFA